MSTGSFLLPSSGKEKCEAAGTACGTVPGMFQASREILWSTDAGAESRDISGRKEFQNPAGRGTSIVSQAGA
jgi:hypothetical protein